ncbi:uncharacterized protein V1510DRAFT_420735 [Dipodascopsis tothii]|uniref:uncharacterized protein n=1 Tax=Dipodascopsis tothii TaxID=44089 RepID=UPI0034CF2077
MAGTDKTVLLTGATGLLGRAVVRKFEATEGWKIVGTGYSRGGAGIVKIDLNDTAAVEKLVAEVKPSIVIHAAAERRPDVAAKNPELTKKLNVFATEQLARITAAQDVPLIYISTDYVFDGSKPPYQPEDKANPTNLYGETKYDGETVVRAENPRGHVLRVPVLYGKAEYNAESAVNILMDVVLNEAKKPKVDMDNWSVRYPTNVDDVARVLRDLSETILAGAAVPPVLHFSSEQKYTKYEICLLYAELMAVPTDHLVRVDELEATPGVIRPHDCHLSSDRLAALGIDVSNVDFKAWWQRAALPLL